jgi:hypothetical protein
MNWCIHISPWPSLHLFVVYVHRPVVTWLWAVNWKEYGRQESWPNLRYYTAMCSKGQRNFTKNIRIVSVPAEMQTYYLPCTFLLMLTAVSQLRQLVAGYPPRRPGFDPVGSVLDKVALGQIFSEYFGFPCQFSFHRLLHTHHHISSGAGIIGQIVADVTKWTQSHPT